MNITSILRNLVSPTPVFVEVSKVDAPAASAVPPAIVIEDDRSGIATPTVTTDESWEERADFDESWHRRSRLADQVMIELARGRILMDRGRVGHRRDEFKRRVRRACERRLPGSDGEQVAAVIAERLSGPVLANYFASGCGASIWKDFFGALVTKSPEFVRKLDWSSSDVCIIFVASDDEFRLQHHVVATAARHFIQTYADYTRVRTRFQAAVHLLSDDPRHRLMGRIWVARNSEDWRGTSWWRARYPGLSRVNAGAVLNGSATPFLPRV